MHASGLLDLGLPGMDGLDVARRLRAEPTLQNTKLVALTGWGQAKDRDSSKSAGFDNHLIKPVDFNALQALLSSINSTATALVAGPATC